MGLFDRVEIYMPEEGDSETIQVVTTVRCDPRKGLISKESPFGKQVLGKKAKHFLKKGTPLAWELID